MLVSLGRQVHNTLCRMETKFEVITRSGCSRVIIPDMELVGQLGELSAVQRELLITDPIVRAGGICR